MKKENPFNIITHINGIKINPEPASKRTVEQFEEELRIMVDSWDYRNMTVEEVLAIADKVITKVWEKNK